MNARADLWRIDVERCGQHVHDGVLSRSEIERAGRFRFERDARAYRVVRGVARYLLSRYTGIDAHALVIENSALGKPFLAVEGAPHFNISHAGSAGLVAISRDAPVGVDIERMEPVDPAEIRRIAALVFSAGEAAELGAAQGAALRVRFYEAWVRNEARLKAQGSGFRTHCPTQGQPWHACTVNAFADYAAAVCMPFAQFDIALRDAEDVIGLNVPTRVA